MGSSGLLRWERSETRAARRQASEGSGSLGTHRHGAATLAFLRPTFPNIPREV